MSEPVGNIPPAEEEAAYYAGLDEQAIAADSDQIASGILGAIQGAE